MPLVKAEEQYFLYELIGNQIKIFRKKSRFSQEQLASKLNLSRTSIVNIEKGRQHISIHLLIDTSRILNAPLSTFLSDEMLKDFNNATTLTRIKKKISTSDEIDHEKIMAFIKQTIKKS